MGESLLLSASTSPRANGWMTPTNAFLLRRTDARSDPPATERCYESGSERAVKLDVLDAASCTRTLESMLMHRPQLHGPEQRGTRQGDTTFPSRRSRRSSQSRLRETGTRSSRNLHQKCLGLQRSRCTALKSPVSSGCIFMESCSIICISVSTVGPRLFRVCIC